MYAKALIAGLERFIKEVEALHDETKFGMNSYYNCVIGKTLGWPGDCTWKNEQLALKSYFDIRRQSYDKYFSSGAKDKFKPAHWEVIRLFTADIGGSVTKQKWLKLANQQLAKMQNHSI